MFRLWHYFVVVIVFVEVWFIISKNNFFISIMIIIRSTYSLRVKFQRIHCCCRMLNLRICKCEGYKSRPIYNVDVGPIIQPGPLINSIWHGTLFSALLEVKAKLVTISTSFFDEIWIWNFMIKESRCESRF